MQCLAIPEAGMISPNIEASQQEPDRFHQDSICWTADLTGHDYWPMLLQSRSAQRLTPTESGSETTMQQLSARSRPALRRIASVWFIVVAVTVAIPLSCGWAADLPAPKGNVLLVVKGAITRTNAGAEARFDRAAFEALGMTKLTTTTAWHEKDTLFEGVLARKLMQAVGATGRSVTAIAANDYRVTIPIADFAKYDVLLATHIDGEQLRLRTKGPIWMIYPDGIDLAPLVRQERMIWQLIELDVE